jgi:hypothetical protein
LAFILTGPFAAVSVTGNDAAALPAAWLLEVELLAVEVPAVEVLAAELQPATSAAAVTAAGIQPILFMMCHFLPGSGRKARPPAASACAGLPRRITLPTRVDIVGRGRSRPGLGPVYEPSQLRDSAGMACCRRRHRLRYLKRRRHPLR